MLPEKVEREIEERGILAYVAQDLRDVARTFGKNARSMKVRAALFEAGQAFAYGQARIGNGGQIMKFYYSFRRSEGSNWVAHREAYNSD